MTNSENLNGFDERREEFKLYGLTCELWSPGIMQKPDRHNEIEVNYFPEGAITYLFQDERVTIPKKRLAIFWALVPHQIVDHQGTTPYFVGTIPFALFLEWKFPVSFVDKILMGEVLLDASDEFSMYDEFLIQNWIKDINSNDPSEVILLEMRARLYRMALNNGSNLSTERSSLDSGAVNKVEKIAIYVARNYARPITVSDIGEAVGLHPDYANAIFKKAFGRTLSDYVIAERISYAQRKLLTTDKTITEIAYDSGFNSIGRFNAAFQKINQCTPRSFRKRYRY